MAEWGPKPVKNKWEGEDESDESDPASDWEESSEEEEEPKPTPAPVAPPKKKGTIKAKLAEKEAARAAAADDDDDDEYDEDAVLDPREKARRDKEREISADLENTASLLGAATLAGSAELDMILTANPRSKEDFQALSAQIIQLAIKRHQDKPLYASFVEHHVRQLAEPLKDVEVRKVASTLTTLANEKQKEQRDKASGKKKPKSAAKPTLGAAKVSKFDTGIYDEALDDFGNGPEDFM